MASSSRPFAAARPKRAGDQFARTHHLSGGSDAPSAKKPRFDPRNPSTLLADDDDDEDDPTLEADVIGKSGAGLKRNAVNIDGYDSDSSTENFDMRAKARFKKAASAESDDEDMFAEDTKDDEQDEQTRRGDKKKKQLRFLDNHEIEGQEESSKAGGHVAADFRASDDMETDDNESSSDSGDDEERDRLDPSLDEELGAGGKKRHAPKLDAFNMKAEQEEGRFDEAGNYVRKAADPNANQDLWLEGITKKDMKKAKEAKEKMEAAQRERERQEDSIATSDVLTSMIQTLIMGETPMEALLRYEKDRPKKRTPNNNWLKKKQQQEQQQQETEVEPDPAEVAKAAKAAKATEAINTITECASRLEARGYEDVYDKEREYFQRAYKRETGEDFVDTNRKGLEWEFRWLNAPADDIHGPFPHETMFDWMADGQFEAGAEFRLVGNTEWERNPFAIGAI